MPSPIIGVTAGRELNRLQVEQHALYEKYTQAIQMAGGIPVIIPTGLEDGAVIDLFQKLDGLLLTGGGDIDPVIFNGEPHPNVYGIDHQRDFLEIELVRLASHSGKPFLGICRGSQVINVALGGTLFTDIAAQLPDSERHDYYPNIPRNKIAHKLNIDGSSLLSKLTGGKRLAVNSLHHQGLKDIPPYLHAVAWSADELVEAVELENHPFGIGVQWHPEWLVENPGNLGIFLGLVQAAEHKA